MRVDPISAISFVQDDLESLQRNSIVKRSWNRLAVRYSLLAIVTFFLSYDFFFLFRCSFPFDRFTRKVTEMKIFLNALESYVVIVYARIISHQIHSSGRIPLPF